jgi:hypothetical protein
MVLAKTPGAGGHGLHDVKCQNLEIDGCIISKKHVIAIAVATVLTASDSGATISVSGGAYEITLPVNASDYTGVNYSIVVNTAPGGAITIAAGSAIIFGQVGESEVDTGDDAPGSGSDTGVSNIIFGTSCHPGDYIDFVSDGTKWFIRGRAFSDAAVTTS